MGQNASLARCQDPSTAVCKKFAGEAEATGDENVLQLLTDATVVVHVSGLFSQDDACALAKPKTSAETSYAAAEASSAKSPAASRSVIVEVADQATTSHVPLAAPDVPAVSSTDMCQGESAVADGPKAMGETRSPRRQAKEEDGKPGGAESMATAAKAGPSARQKGEGKRASTDEEPAKPKGKPLVEQQAADRKPARKPAKKDEPSAQIKNSERSRQASRKPPRKEESSDGSDNDLTGCPSSRKDKDFERELKKVKKQMRSGISSQPVEEPSNPMLHTEASDAERQLKKDMFVSFYREQYARLKKNEEPAQPDVEQYAPGSANTLKITEGHRYMPRPKNVDLPTDFRKPVGTLTDKQLAERGCESKRMLVCIHGDLFDVSDRPDKYGSTGPYWYMTGHDITWGLVSGDDDQEFMDFYYDMFKIKPRERADRKLQGLMSWWAFFEKEYGSPVGRLDVYEKEWMLPPPPDGSLDTECSVM